MAETSERGGTAHRGPPLLLLAGVHVVLFLAALVVLNGATSGTWPLPGADPATIRQFLADNAGLVEVVGMLQFGAAVPLLLYGATASSRLRHLGIRAAGATIALAGGVAAGVLLATSGLLMTVAGSTAGAGSDATAVVLHQAVFVTGGTGYVVFLGLLLAGIAVTSLLARQLPAWVCWAVLAVAVAAGLSTLALVVDPLRLLVPIGRVGGTAALLVAGALLPTRRTRTEEGRFTAGAG